MSSYSRRKDGTNLLLVISVGGGRCRIHATEVTRGGAESGRGARKCLANFGTFACNHGNERPPLERMRRYERRNRRHGKDRERTYPNESRFDGPDTDCGIVRTPVGAARTARALANARDGRHAPKTRRRLERPACLRETLTAAKEIWPWKSMPGSRWPSSP